MTIAYTDSLDSLVKATACILKDRDGLDEVGYASMNLSHYAFHELKKALATWNEKNPTRK